MTRPKRPDRPLCASVSPNGNQCVLFAGHTVQHGSAFVLGESVGDRWHDALTVSTKAGYLAAVEIAARELDEANQALDTAMRYAFDAGARSFDVAVAAKISRATLFRRLAQ